MNESSVWSSPIITASTPQTIELQSTSVDTSLAIVFGGNRLQLPPETGPMGLTQMVSIRVPIAVEKTQNLVGYLQDIGIGITKSNGARVFIVVDLAGTSKTFEFPFENPTAATIEVPLKFERIFSVQGLEFASAVGVGLSGAVPDYEATILIGVQRRSLQDHALVSIDQLDIMAILGER